jgi:hypothetical protein
LSSELSRRIKLRLHTLIIPNKPLQMPSASRLSRQLSLLEVRIIHLLDKADINELQTGGNPAFRIYDVDPDTYEIMDSLTYFSKSLTIILDWYSMNFIGDMSDPNYQITRGCSRSIIHFI